MGANLLPGSAGCMYKCGRTGSRGSGGGSKRRRSSASPPLMGQMRPAKSGAGTWPGPSGPARALFHCLFLILDLYSRKIVGGEVYEREAATLGVVLLEAVPVEGCIKQSLVPHSDNDFPMKRGDHAGDPAPLGGRGLFPPATGVQRQSVSRSRITYLQLRPRLPRGTC